MTWVNTEGRSQLGRTAVVPPGAAREDWQILRALSEEIGQPLPYDDVLSLRDRMWDISPTLVRYETVEPVSNAIASMGLSGLAKSKVNASSGEALKLPIKDFYQTNVVARASVTMAACSKAFVKQDYELKSVDSAENQVSVRGVRMGGS